MDSNEIFTILAKHRKEDDILTFYTNHAKDYDALFDTKGYVGINEYAGILMKQYVLEHSTDAVLGDVKILDVACGTGFTGSILQKTGFQNLDCIDGCQSMLDIAKGKQIYRNLYKGMLTENEKFDLKDESYDVISAIGCIGGAHIKLPVAIPEFHRLLKQGGIAVYTIAPSLDPTKAMEDHLKCFYEKKFQLLKLERRFFIDMKDNTSEYCHIYAVQKL